MSVITPVNINTKRPLIDETSGSAPKRLRVVKPVGLTLKKEYIEQIRDGLLLADGTRIYKTVEGRIHNRAFKNLREGSLIDFFYMSNRKDNVVCRVTQKNIYPTFAAMLAKEGVSKCLPKLRYDELAKAIKMYEAIPGYGEKSKKFGVVALQLEVKL